MLYMQYLILPLPIHYPQFKDEGNRQEWLCNLPEDTYHKGAEN
jgi:hypothetical protein